MSTNTRITPELGWEAMRGAFRIGAIKLDGKTIEVNELAIAIEDGTLDAMMKTCADNLHAGDVYSALLAFSKNLSSKKCNLKKQPRNINTGVDKTMLELLTGYTSAKMAELKGSSRSGNSKAYWQYTMEEIEACNEYATIKSIYENMCSVASKYPERIESVDDFQAKKEFVAKKRSEMLKAQKNTPAKVDDALLAKLAGGKKTTLSADQAAFLADLLAKLQK